MGWSTRVALGVMTWGEGLALICEKLLVLLYYFPHKVRNDSRGVEKTRREKEGERVNTE